MIFHKQLLLASGITAVLGLFMGLVGCSSVPVSGRQQLNLVSDTEVTEMSVKQFNELKQQSRILRDPAVQRKVEAIAYDIIEQVNWWDVPLAEWEVLVFDEPGRINAFAMAGGKIGVYTGLLNMVENEDQLAFVIAHEIAHVTSKHVHERLSQAMVTEAGGTALGTAAVVTGVSTGNTMLYSLYSLYGMGSGYASLSFNREKEREADYVGIILMAKAGYDPRQAVRVVELIDQKAAASGKTAPPAWLSTHPSYGERITKLYEYEEAALEYYQDSEGMDVERLIGL